MHIENISYDKMSLDRNGQSMLIQVYEKEIYRLNNIINELEKYLEEESRYNEYKDVFYREHMGSVLEILKELKEE